MATTTLTTLTSIWGNIRAVPSGHFACYAPGPADTLTLYGPDGKKLAESHEAARDFDLDVDPATGEIFALFTKFQDSGIPIRRWATGIFAAKPAAPTPTPTPVGNAAIRAEIIRLAGLIT